MQSPYLTEVRKRPFPYNFAADYYTYQLGLRDWDNDDFFTADRIAGIEKAITMIPEPYRDVINLRYKEQLSYAAISSRLNTGRGTPSQRLYRFGSWARKKKQFNVLMVEGLSSYNKRYSDVFIPEKEFIDAKELEKKKQKYREQFLSFGKMKETPTKKESGV